MSTLLAALPVVVACAALAARISSARAVALGLLTALVVIPSAFPTDAGELASGLLGWSPTLLAVVLIIGGGIALARLLDVSGAQRRLARALESTALSPTAAMLLVVHGAVPFAESVTGFGVGVMVGVPLLLHLGRTPSRAAVLSMLGLVAVPWGSLGPGTLIAARMNGLDLTELGVACAVVNGVVFVVGGLAAVVVDGAPTAGRLLGGLASGAALWAATWSANVVVGTPLAGALGALAVVAGHLAAGRLRGRRIDEGGIGRALVPYAVLVAGLLAASGLVRAGVLPEGGALAAVADSPALWLAIACAVAACALPFERGQRAATIRGAVGTWFAVGVPTGGFLLLGVLMATTGMSGALAQAASGLGRGYLALAPWIGGLGGFVTGSNAGANSMFAAAQGEAARSLGVSTLQLVAVQNCAAGALTMAAPSRVEMALGLCPPARRPDRGRVMGVVLVVNAFMLAGLSALTLLTL